MSTATPPPPQADHADTLTVSGKSLSLHVLPTPHRPGKRIALIGTPNAGKTTLFNKLTGLRARTANFAGTTVERRSGLWLVNGQRTELLDLPGLYAMDATTPDEAIAVAALSGGLAGNDRPDGAVIVVDATQLNRQLFLASQAREAGLPAVVAITQWDRAKAQGVTIDFHRLADELQCAVVPISAKTGEGLDELNSVVACELLGNEHACPTAQSALMGNAESLCPSACGGCPQQARYDWADRVFGTAIHHRGELSDKATDRLDAVLAHPWVGLLAFAGVAFAVFALLFQIAAVPMDWIDQTFAAIGSAVANVLPEGLLASFFVDGLIGGVGGVIIFLPQIMLLFFALSLLDDSGYLARAALVMDRLMQRVGLPGRAFIPMLSAHACAIPALMSTRVIENRRDRLVTMLIIPLLTCSARLPVYVMLVALLFIQTPLIAGAVMLGCYLLGIVAALIMGFVFRHTFLQGKPAPLLIELPAYRLPSFRGALIVMLDRGWVFLKQAGGIILAISIVLWFASTFPQLPEDRVAQTVSTEQRTELVALATAADAGDEAAQAAYDNRIAQAQAEYSVAGRIGRAMEPVFAPLGFTWQMNVGVISSFAAREVFVSTMAIVHGVGDAEEGKPLYDLLAQQKRADGSPAFNLPTCLSLLVFFVLAMQCLPTQAVMKKETGTWKWPIFQLLYMSALAYSGAFITYQIATALSAT